MLKKIENVVIIGAGNVASHLAIFLSKKIEIKGIISKNKTSALQLSTKLNCPFIDDLSSIPSCDLVLICTNDDAIEQIESQISINFNVAYTSGSVDLNSKTQRKNYGVFYPLQSFSKDKAIDISKVPIFIEAKNEEFGQKLFELANIISENVAFASSIERKKIHITAIFINNFSNHLAYIANKFAEENDLNWEYFKPLIKETTDKILLTSPFEAQTGPARRKDYTTIEQHLSMLNGFSKEIYNLLSNSIINTYTSKK